MPGSRPADTSDVNPRAWRLLLAAFAVIAAVELLVDSRHARVAAFTAACALAAAVLAVAPGRNGERNRQPWTLMCGAVVALGLAEALQQLAGTAATAAWAVPLRGLTAMLLTIAVWLVVADPPGRRRRSLIEPAILAVGAGVVSWIFILDPIVRQSDLAMADRVVALAVPTLDMALLAVVIRFAFSCGVAGVPNRLFVAGIFVFLAGDTVNSVDTIGSLLGGGGSVRVLWTVAVGLLAATAAHPFMESLSEHRADTGGHITTQRIVMLGIAAVAGPIALIVRSSLNTRFNIPVVVGGTVVLFVLILLRMAGLVRALGTAAQSHAQATGREKILRRAAHALVAATDRHAIYATAADAAGALVRDRQHSQVRLFIGDADAMRLVASRGPRNGGPSLLEPSALPGRCVEQLRGADSATVVFGDPGLAPEVAAAIGATASHPECLLAPLFVDGVIVGLLVVALDRAPGESRRRALETVGSQAALAIETAGLTENLHARAGEERFRSLVQNASDVIAVIEPGGTIRFVTRSISPMLGFDPALLEGVSITRLLHPDDAESGHAPLVDGAVVDWRLRCYDGGFRHVEVIVADLSDDPNVAGIVLTMRDVTERRELESRLVHQAFHDTLTGLANRALFEDRLGQALARRARGATGAVGVIFIDLDDFKGVNDTLGHQAGDELLSMAARRIVACLRPTDTAARFGGDEFAITVEVDDFDVDEALDIVARRILASLREPFLIEGQEVYSRGSLGVAATPEGGITVEDLLRNADIAMYIAKSSGKGLCKRFEPGMHAPVLRQMELKGELNRAIERREFVLHYQPIVSLATGRLRGFESLVRWEHPEHGTIPPGDFITLAEEAGLIVPMGGWILEEACRQFQEWQTTYPGLDPLYISVNLSGQQLHRDDLVAELDGVIARTGIDPQRILLELTETVLVEDTERAIRCINALKSRGVRIAIDDFGTGFSALAYLRALPVDVLKLASPFVDGLATGQEPLTETILRLASQLGLTVIAEGIEHAHQAATLARLGCGAGQGYFFSRPLPGPLAASLLTIRSFADRDPVAVI
jgi:diguanylate cyclase (GGDEF)-like protein/PAS domain S-box-containing protein